MPGYTAAPNALTATAALRALGRSGGHELFRGFKLGFILGFILGLILGLILELYWVFILGFIGFR